MNAKRENIIFITEFIIKIITVISVILMAVSILGMIEMWSISGIPLVTFEICFAWLGIIGVYKMFIIR